MPPDLLAKTYGRNIADAVTRKLQSTLGAEDSISSDATTQLMDMAQLCSDTYSGVDFVTRLCCSAASGGVNFRHVCKSLGVSPSIFDACERRRIDSTMDILFQRALQRGRAPVPLQTAQTWLRSLIHRSLKEVNIGESKHEQPPIVGK